ncbi:MAG: hypothetical protein ACE5M4_10330 [Anaerolineales bacterium]
MVLIILSAFPILLTEYGFQSRGRIVEGFTTNWRWTRTLVRLVYWALVMVGMKLRPPGLLVAGLGLVLSELGVIVLRRRMRIDVEKGRPHGVPYVHLIPYVPGLLFWGLYLIDGQENRLELLDGSLRIGSLVPIFIFSVVALWGWATMFTVSVVDLVRPGQVREEADRVGAGDVIGVIERLVTFVLIASGAFTAVGFVIAAKAAARFPLFKEKAFAEYFLIGTLTSVGLALLLGLLASAAS